MESMTSLRNRAILSTFSFALFPVSTYCFFKHLLLNFVLVYAEVAELVDALDSGSSGRKPVWVQVPSSAPHYRHQIFLPVRLR